MNYNKSKKLICIAIVIVLLISSTVATNKTVYAKAKKLKLSVTSISVAVSKNATVKVTGSYKIKVKNPKKKIIKVSVKGKKITIKGLKEGSAKLTVKGYKNGKLKAKSIVKVNVIKGSVTETDPAIQPTVAPSPAATPSTETAPSPTQAPASTQPDTPAPTVNPVVTPTITPGQPSEDTIAFDAGEYSLNKVHSGEGTFYDPQAGGAASLDDYALAHNFYTAAMNNEDYKNGLAGAYVEITDKDGDKINVLIADRLPGGAKGDIDLTRTAFNVIEPEVTGRMDITWKIIPLPTDEPIQIKWKEGSTQYWCGIQIRNNRYPVSKLEYWNNSTSSYVELNREEYNYYIADKLFVGYSSCRLRITDFYGHSIIEDVPIPAEAAPAAGIIVTGKTNFPY